MWGTDGLWIEVCVEESAARAVQFLNTLFFSGRHVQVFLLHLLASLGGARCLDRQSTAARENRQRAVLTGDSHRLKHVPTGHRALEVVGMGGKSLFATGGVIQRRCRYQAWSRDG